MRPGQGPKPQGYGKPPSPLPKPMTIRKQVEALRKKAPWPQFGPLADGATAARAAHSMALDEVIDIIEAHRCIDPERLARALRQVDFGAWGSQYDAPEDFLTAAAAAIAAAYEGVDDDH